MSELTPFLFDGLPVRGMLVRLTDAWQEVLSRRQDQGGLPAEVRVLLGELTAAAVLMQANIKFNGALVIQVFGDGPVKLAVAEVQPDLAFRATAKVVGEVPPGAQLETLLNVHGQGRCAITLDPLDKRPGQQPYQGVVPLYGDQREPLQQVSQVLEHYMLQSEQLDTRLVLAANDEIAAGLLIQRLPVTGSGNLAARRNEDDIGLSEAYNRIALLAATLTRDELLTLPAE
ncbi:MAG TPA: Hsp33 family molecular chaperone HslO, partial [Rubrivivax sp.]|nr:Hsp33 family molecular chaperone HslO [Rubrivivax sp.]